MNILPNKRTLFFLSLFLLSVCLLYARAGGGGGSGGSGGGGPFAIVGLIIWGIYTVCLTIVIFFRRKAARKVLNSSKEGLWDLSFLEQTAEKAFYGLQGAWMERDLHRVSKMITYHFYTNYDWQLQNMITQGEKNMLENISLRSIQIIGCKDYLENSKDSFVALIKGTMIDYTVNENTGQVIKGSRTKQEKFTDLYIFTRDDNTWLLNQIINDPEMNAILSARSVSEENQPPTPALRNTSHRTQSE